MGKKLWEFYCGIRRKLLKKLKILFKICLVFSYFLILPFWFKYILNKKYTSLLDILVAFLLIIYSFFILETFNNFLEEPKKMNYQYYNMTNKNSKNKTSKINKGAS